MLVMLSLLVNLDQTLTHFIFNLPHPFLLQSFFGFFSVKGVSLLVWLVIVFCLIIIEGKRDKRFIIYFGLSLITATLLFTAIKNLIQRPRPLSDLRIKNYDLRKSPSDYPRDYSFPSGHATIAFAGTAILAAFNPKRKKYFYLLALMIAFSRVYLGYHYVLDVITGAILGALVSHGLLHFKMKN